MNSTMMSRGSDKGSGRASKDRDVRRAARRRAAMATQRAGLPDAFYVFRQDCREPGIGQRSGVRYLGDIHAPDAVPFEQ
jgi:hypothetical protein